MKWGHLLLLLTSMVSQSYAMGKPLPTAERLKALFDSSSAPYPVTIDTSARTPSQFYDCQFIGEDIPKPEFYFIDTEFTSPSRGLTHVVRFTPRDEIEYILQQGGIFHGGRLNVDGVKANQNPSPICTDGTSILSTFDHSKSELSADGMSYVLSSACDNGITKSRHFRKYKQDYLLMRLTQTSGANPDNYGYCRMSPNVPKLFEDAAKPRPTPKPATPPLGSSGLIECLITTKFTKNGIPLLGGGIGTGKTKELAIKNAIWACEQDAIDPLECAADKITDEDCYDVG